MIDPGWAGRGRAARFRIHPPTEIVPLRPSGTRGDPTKPPGDLYPGAGAVWVLGTVRRWPADPGLAGRRYGSGDGHNLSPAAAISGDPVCDVSAGVTSSGASLSRHLIISVDAPADVVIEMKAIRRSSEDLISRTTVWGIGIRLAARCR